MTNMKSEDVVNALILASIVLIMATSSYLIYNMHHKALVGCDSGEMMEHFGQSMQSSSITRFNLLANATPAAIFDTKPFYNFKKTSSGLHTTGNVDLAGTNLFHENFEMSFYIQFDKLPQGDGTFTFLTLYTDSDSTSSNMIKFGVKKYSSVDATNSAIPGTYYGLKVFTDFNESGKGDKPIWDDTLTDGLTDESKVTTPTNVNNMKFPTIYAFNGNGMTTSGGDKAGITYFIKIIYNINQVTCSNGSTVSLCGDSSPALVIDVREMMNKSNVGHLSFTNENYPFSANDDRTGDETNGYNYTMHSAGNRAKSIKSMNISSDLENGGEDNETSVDNMNFNITGFQMWNDIVR
jgi:hypothetical protein